MAQFKKTLSSLGVCAALMMAAQANAANDATLKVLGNIVPAACTPTLSSDGEVSFGTIAASTIESSASGNSLVQLGSKEVMLSISCEAKAAVGFKMVDNRASSAVALNATSYIEPVFAGTSAATEAYFGFGLGLANNNAKIGAYSVSLDSARVAVDGEQASIIISDNAGSSWRDGKNARQINNGVRIATFAQEATTQPMLFKEASLPLKISAAVQTSSVLGGDEIIFDGNATVSLVYL